MSGVVSNFNTDVITDTVTDGSNMLNVRDNDGVVQSCCTADGGNEGWKV